MSAEDPLEKVLVLYGPEQLQDIAVHDQEDGSAVIETVTCRSVQVFEKQADRSLVELHGEDKDRALETFWADVEAFKKINNINGENNR
ncbi:hypothetical protein KBY91_15330 [Streptomyces sp. RK23]|uniref:hypothetical protein n=1 Tax=Streptomyces TaxID=1883 RepID=UPI001B35B3A6|nr:MULTISPECIES: hypothetical protein [unclassified Streptomyces]MBQ0969200.1 hypothetical protein [Streptomyces sp. RK74B]MBQ1004781.1 hypothetical protein [Streptomyces sp. RK23]